MRENLYTYTRSTRTSRNRWRIGVYNGPENLTQNTHNPENHAIMNASGPSELSEQIRLVARLERAGIVFFHVPNGGRRSRVEAITLKKSGVRRGVPDLVIPVPPAQLHCSRCMRPAVVGAVVELKRADGKPSDVRVEQRHWLELFEANGWLAIVAFGADDAAEQLRRGGYAL